MSRTYNSMKGNWGSRTTIIYSPAVADALLIKGEQLLHVRPNLKNPSENVFVFVNSPTMREHLKEAEEGR